MLKSTTKFLTGKCHALRQFSPTFIEADKQYNVRTKNYHTKQYVNGPVFFNRDVDHFQITTFLKKYGCDEEKHNPGVKSTVDMDSRDIIDEIAGVKNIYLS